MSKEELINPLLYRYPINSRFMTLGAFNHQSISPDEKIEVGESCTDKETYRLTMASKRGSIGSLNNFGDFSNSKAYMFPDGVYDSQKDFSLLLRKDLSIVELDEIIADLTEKQKNADEQLKTEIAEQLEFANNKKQEISKNENISSSEDSSGA